MVFHRILDKNTGLDFYPGPFFILRISFYNADVGRMLQVVAAYLLSIIYRAVFICIISTNKIKNFFKKGTLAFSKSHHIKNP